MSAGISSLIDNINQFSFWLCLTFWNKTLLVESICSDSSDEFLQTAKSFHRPGDFFCLSIFPENAPCVHSSKLGSFLSEAVGMLIQILYLRKRK